MWYFQCMMEKWDKLLTMGKTVYILGWRTGSSVTSSVRFFRDRDAWMWARTWMCLQDSLAVHDQWIIHYLTIIGMTWPGQDLDLRRHCCHITIILSPQMFENMGSLVDSQSRLLPWYFRKCLNSGLKWVSSWNSMILSWLDDKREIPVSHLLADWGSRKEESS